MAGLIENLINLVEKQYENITDLTELSKEKKEVLIANQVNELQKIINIETILTNQVMKLDKERELLFKDISDILKLDNKTLTLKSLSKSIKNKENSKKLMELSDEMNEKMEELKDINKKNKILIETAVEYTTFSLNAFKNTMLGEATYFSLDGSEIENLNKFFDTKK